MRRNAQILCGNCTETLCVLPPISCAFTVRSPSPLEYLSCYRTFPGWTAGAELGDFTVRVFGKPSCKMHQTGAHRFARLKVFPEETAKQKVKEAPQPPYSSRAAEASPATQLPTRPSTAIVNCLQAKGNAVRQRKLEGSGKSSGSSAGC